MYGPVLCSLPKLLENARCSSQWSQTIYFTKRKTGFYLFLQSVICFGQSVSFIFWTKIQFHTKKAVLWLPGFTKRCISFCSNVRASIHYSLSIPAVFHRSMNKNCSNWLCLVWAQLQGLYLQTIWNQIMSIWWKNSLQWIQMGTLILSLLIH